MNMHEQKLSRIINELQERKGNAPIRLKKKTVSHSEKVDFAWKSDCKFHYRKLG